MKKGDLVKLDPNDAEIARILEWHGPQGSSHGKKFIASRPATHEERQAWREQKTKEIEAARQAGEDTFSIAFDDGGESRLPPRSISVPLSIDGIYIVERARCRVELGWGRATGGMAKILDTKSGEIAYVKRDMLKVIEQ
jgi:hypothetical protein